MSAEEFEFPEPKVAPLTESELLALRSDQDRVALDDFNTIANTNGRPEKSRILAYQRLSAVTPRSIRFLDRPFWQRGAFHLVAGKKGSAKGTYLAHLASRVTTGKLYDRPMNVMWLGSEDSDEIDIHPRVTAAGGDLDRIVTFTEPVRFPQDIEALYATAREIGDVGLLAIDPIGNHLGGVKTNDEGTVRNAIAPLNDLADELDLLLYGVRHLGKDTTRGGLDSILGSTAWRDVPRSVIVFAEDDEQDLLFHMEVVAGNRGPKSQGRMFQVELVDLPGLEEPITKAVELGDSEKAIDDLLDGERPKRHTRSGEARGLILDILERRGEVEVDALDSEVAKQTGLAMRTVTNLRLQLNAEGLTRSVPLDDETGKRTGWSAKRINAPLTTGH